MQMDMLVAVRRHAHSCMGSWRSPAEAHRQIGLMRPSSLLPPPFLTKPSPRWQPAPAQFARRSPPVSLPGYSRRSRYSQERQCCGAQRLTGSSQAQALDRVPTDSDVSARNCSQEVDPMVFPLKLVDILSSWSVSVTN